VESREISKFYRIAPDPGTPKLPDDFERVTLCFFGIRLVQDGKF
jgi:hypothetical protein